MVSAGSIQADCSTGLAVGIVGLVKRGQPRTVDDCHAAGHTPAPNWRVFLDFAVRYFK